MRPGLWQILLVVVLIFVLFGSSKIPGMMKNLAGGINAFKKELKDDDNKSADKKHEVAAEKKTPVKKDTKKSAVKSASKPAAKRAGVTKKATKAPRKK